VINAGAAAARPRHNAEPDGSNVCSPLGGIAGSGDRRDLNERAHPRRHDPERRTPPRSPVRQAAGTDINKIQACAQ
jgi:hypothetical protein